MMVHVGFDHYLAVEDILLLCDGSTPAAKRMVKAHKANGGLLIPLNRGRRIKCLILTKKGIWYHAALNPETIARRMEGHDDQT